MTSPMRAVCDGKYGIANKADADEWCSAPVAVRMVATGAVWLMLVTGAVVVK